MNHRKNWKRKLKKNWKTWLLSLFMALILISGGVSTILRANRAAARRHPAPTVTGTATLTPTPSPLPPTTAEPTTVQKELN